MKTVTRVVALLGTALMLAGCASDPGKMSSGELEKTRRAAQEVRVGMTTETALAGYPKGNKVRLSTSTVNGVAIEEWKVEAYHDDDWNKSRDLFVSFLYFANDKLVDISDTRQAYREDPGLVEQWTSGRGGG